MKILSVFLGGGCGALLRYTLNLLLIPRISHWGTFVINILGSFGIGIIGALTLRHILPRPLNLFLITGFLGGFTTFSTFQLENLLLVQNGQSLSALIYTLGSLLGGFLAIYLGFLSVSFFYK